MGTNLRFALRIGFVGFVAAGALSLVGCDLVLGLDDYKECSTTDCGSGGSANTTSASMSTMSTSTSGACPTLTLMGDADRTMTVGDDAMVTVMVDGVADSIEWTQTGGPPIALPAAGATSFTYEPPYVHDTFALRATAKKAGCADSAADVTLTPVAKGVGVYVAPPPLGVDGAAGDAAHPLARIDEAMAKAAGAPIYVAAGTYVQDGYVVAGDMQIHGGYTPGPVWHRAHKTTVSKLSMPHVYASMTTELVYGFDCRTAACTIGGFDIEQSIQSMTPTSKGATVGVRLGPHDASIFENIIRGPAFPQTDGHGSIGISDTESFSGGGVGNVVVHSNRLLVGQGIGCIGVWLEKKSSMLATWTVANNFIDISAGFDDSGGVLLGEPGAILSNTIILSAKSVGTYTKGANQYANVIRSNFPESGGMGCEPGGGSIDRNSIFGFTLAVDDSCPAPANPLTVDPTVTADGQLQTGSPAVDFAPFTNPIVDLLPPWDIDGDLRRQGAGLDLGCDELK